MSIDYDRMRKAWPKQKAALTRAVKTGNPEKIAAVCIKAVNEWDEIGAWPDDWARFERALGDVLHWSESVSLQDIASGRATVDASGRVTWKY